MKIIIKYLKSMIIVALFLQFGLAMNALAVPVACTGVSKKCDEKSTDRTIDGKLFSCVECKQTLCRDSGSGPIAGTKTTSECTEKAQTGTSTFQSHPLVVPKHGNKLTPESSSSDKTGRIGSILLPSSNTSMALTTDDVSSVDLDGAKCEKVTVGYWTCTKDGKEYTCTGKGTGCVIMEKKRSDRRRFETPATSGVINKPKKTSETKKVIPPEGSLCTKKSNKDRHNYCTFPDGSKWFCNKYLSNCVRMKRKDVQGQVIPSINNKAAKSK